MAHVTGVATILSPRADEPTEATFRACVAADGEHDGVEVTLERRGPGVLRARVTWPDLAVTCDVAGDGTEELRRRVAGVLAYAREMSVDPLDPVPRLIVGARQVIAWQVEPGFDDEGRAEALLLRLARDRQGLLLREGRVLDASGACLLAPPGRDADQVLRPPSAERVARRALVLSAVVWRASLEQEKGRRRAAQLQAHLLRWLERHDLDHELEDEERELLEAPLGSLERQRAIDASWRSEGLAVLGWALDVSELPPHDEQADPQAVAVALGFLEDDEPPRALEAPRLRPPEELEAMGRRLQALHWRLREFMQRPVPVDFRAAAVAATAVTAPDVDDLPLVGGDLALRGAALADAPPDLVGECASIALERHRAINWLLGFDELYSAVDTTA